MKIPFEEFLNTLGEVLGFSNLQPDSNGACLVVLKQDEIPLLFEFDDNLVPNTILVSSEICPIPQEISGIVLEQALIANYFINETLSCQPDGNFLYLHKRFHPNIPPLELKMEIDNLANQVRTWRSSVKTLLQSPPHKAEQETPASFKMHQFKV